MPWPSTLQRLADLAEDQWGLFTYRQARAVGLAGSTVARLVADDAIERICQGVYRLRGVPPVADVGLRAAWLTLAPLVLASARLPEQGMVSHRSAAALYGLGHLPADVHEFTLPVRRQTRRADVRLHISALSTEEIEKRSGLWVTRPGRIAADLLADTEDPQAVGHILAEAIGSGLEDHASAATAISGHAARFGLRRGDGAALLAWLTSLTESTQPTTAGRT